MTHASISRTGILVYCRVSSLRGPLILGALSFSFLDFVPLLAGLDFALSPGELRRTCDELTPPIGLPLRVVRVGGLDCAETGVGGDAA